MKKIILTVAYWGVVVMAFAQSSGQNYKHVITPKQLFMNEAGVNTALGDNTRVLEEITYYNGLGYTDQVVQRGTAAIQRDMVTPFYYDAFGRPTRNYLPFRSALGTGGYIGDATTAQGTYYSSSGLTGVAATTHAYSEVVMEQSPLNREVEQGFEGPNFQPGTGRTIRKNTRTNTAADQVMLMGYDYSNKRPVLGRNQTSSSAPPSCVMDFNNPAMAGNWNNCAFNYNTHGLQSNVQPICPNSPVGDVTAYVFNTPSTSGPITFYLGPGSYRVNFKFRNTQYISNFLTLSLNGVAQKTVDVGMFFYSNWHDFDQNINITSVGLVPLTISLSGPSSHQVFVDHIQIFNNQQNTYTYTPHYYDNGSLLVEEITDENNRLTTRFTNKEGQLILNRLHKGIDKLDTYYIYGDYGVLNCVVPPEGVKKLAANGYDFVTGINVLEKYCFNYTYDERKRLVAKTLPGGNTIYLVYDLLDRPVLTQDNNLRAANKWFYSKYDELGRLIYTGTFQHNTATRASLQADINSANQTNNLFEAPTNVNAGIGYTSDAFPTSLLDTLSVYYYDDYDVDNDGTDDYDVFASGKFGTVEYSKRIQTLPTIIKHKVALTATTFAWTQQVMYYDVDQRVIFNFQSLPGGDGYVATEHQYSFTNQIVQTKTYHALNNTQTPKELVRKFNYDKNSRVKNAWIKYDQMTEMLLSNTAYNDVGQVTVKNIHSYNETHPFLQHINYTYHIRGWLKSINDVNNFGKEDLFAMGFQYENAFSNTNVGGTTTATKQYNGNLSAYNWVSRRDEAVRGFTFAYDELNRITDATYFGASKVTPSKPQTSENGRYNALDVTYDDNGNILQLKHDGVTAPVIAGGQPVYGNFDDLRYTYDGNRLKSVTDLATYQTTQLNDLTDNNKTGDDYSYDANGNMVIDRNKNITQITYNHLNLPIKLEWANGDVLQHIYDAAGKKWESKFYQGGLLKEHHQYYGEFIYLNGNLDAIQHEEGRLAAEKTYPSGAPANTPPTYTGNFLYHYDYKDHQGNVRMTYTPDLDKEGRWKCTYENPEVDVYPYVPDMEDPQKPVFGRWDSPIRNMEKAYQAPDGPESIYSGKVTNAEGTHILFDIQKGDTIEAEVFYQAAVENAPNALNGEVPFFSLFGASAGYITYDGEGTPHYTGPMISFNFLGYLLQLINPNNNNEEERAGAMVIRTYDADGNFQNGHVYGAYYNSSWQKLEGQYIVNTDTEVKAEVLLTAKDGQTVFYDDLFVQRKRMLARIVQENHYYPYGLNIKGLEYIAPDGPNDYNQYNGKEVVLRNNLEWNDYGARYYDPQIGRWHSEDPLADDEQESFSIYHYGACNPVNKVDPDGMKTSDYILLDKNDNVLLKTEAPGADQFFVGYRTERGTFVEEYQTTDPAQRAYLNSFPVQPDNSPVPGRGLGGELQKGISANKSRLDAAMYFAEFSATVATSGLGGLSSRAVIGKVGNVAARTGTKLITQFSSKTIDDAVAYAMKNKVTHIFAKVAHKLDPLVTKLGGYENTFRSVLNAANGKLPSSGVFNNISVNVGGYNVIIRGSVVNGVPKIGTMFIP